MNTLIKEIESLLSALHEYDCATDKLHALQFPEIRPEIHEDDSTIESLGFTIDDIESAIQEREEIRERLEVLRLSIIERMRLIESEGSDSDSVKLIMSFFAGTEVAVDSPSSLTDEMRGVKSLIEEILSLQSSIAAKDSVIIERLTSKQKEIRIALKNLQADKKKLDFLNLTATGPKDSGFQV